MSIKIFISHKKEDEFTALMVQRKLEQLEVDAYLDVLDSTIVNDGEKLTKHIRGKLRECTDVIVILSEDTKKSWWVPFEIGMATQKDMPIANYLINSEELPEYLEYWPRLKNLNDVQQYVEVRNALSEQVMLEKSFGYGFAQRVDDRMTETQRFYAELKKKI